MQINLGSGGASNEQYISFFASNLTHTYIEVCDPSGDTVYPFGFTFAQYGYVGKCPSGYTLNTASGTCMMSVDADYIAGSSSLSNLGAPITLSGGSLDTNVGNKSDGKGGFLIGALDGILDHNQYQQWVYENTAPNGEKYAILWGNDPLDGYGVTPYPYAVGYLGVEGGYTPTAPTTNGNSCNGGPCIRIS